MMRSFTYLLLLFTLVLYSCGGDTQEMDMDQGGLEEEDPTAVGEDNDMSSRENISLTDMPPTEDFPNAAIDEWNYENGTMSYEVSNYEFSVPTPDADQLMCANSDKGQHVHLIIDNEPYIAKYEPTFEQTMTDGEHYILTFLSRSYHESIKEDPAHRAVRVNVDGGNFTANEDITDPMLFYSRPKGTYRGREQTENVMLDFYPVNVDLGGEYKVKANINGKEFMIDEWKPYYIQGLPMGENTVQLTLMQGDSIVDAPYNPVRRTFTLEENPMESR